MNTQLLNDKNILVNAQNKYYFVEKQIYIYIYMKHPKKWKKNCIIGTKRVFHSCEIKLTFSRQFSINNIWNFSKKKIIKSLGNIKQHGGHGS